MSTTSKAAARRAKNRAPTPVHEVMAQHASTALQLEHPKPNVRSQAERALLNAQLNDQQKLFVQYWAAGDTPGAAALRAGYANQDNGYQLKVRPNILAMYHQLKEQYAKAAEITREDVMNGLKEAIEMARLMSEPATMIAGWREIAKLCGFYEPKKIDVNVSVNGALVIDRMNKMSDRELLDIIQQANATGEMQEDVMERLMGPSPAATPSEPDPDTPTEADQA